MAGPVNVLLTQAEIDKLDEVARHLKVSRAQVVRWCIQVMDPETLLDDLRFAPADKPQ